jgi:hypothetical protein
VNIGINKVYQRARILKIFELLGADLLDKGFQIFAGIHAGSPE